MSHPLSSDQSCQKWSCDQSLPVCIPARVSAAASRRSSAAGAARDRAVSTSPPPCCAAHDRERSRQFGARLRATPQPVRRRLRSRHNAGSSGRGRRHLQPWPRTSASSPSSSVRTLSGQGSRTPHRRLARRRRPLPAGQLARGVGRRDDQSAERADVGLRIRGDFCRTFSLRVRLGPSAAYAPKVSRITHVSKAGDRRGRIRSGLPVASSLTRRRRLHGGGRAARREGLGVGRHPGGPHRVRRNCRPREPDGRHVRERAQDSGARRFPDR